MKLEKNPVSGLVLFLTNLLAIPLASQRFFHTLLLAGFQVEGVTLDLFDDVFSLYFPLEAAQGVFERFTLLNSNLCQGKTPHNQGQKGYPVKIRYSQSKMTSKFDKNQQNVQH